MTPQFSNIPAIDTTIMEEARTSMGGQFNTIVDWYFEDAEEYLGQIKDGLANNNANTIIAPAHTIKSSSKQLGAIQVSEIAKALEAEARQLAESTNGDTTALEPLITSIDTALAELQPAYQKLIG